MCESVCVKLCVCGGVCVRVCVEIHTNTCPDVCQKNNKTFRLHKIKNSYCVLDVQCSSDDERGVAD